MVTEKTKLSTSATGSVKSVLLPSLENIPSNTTGCGKILRALSTTLYLKVYKGPRLISVPNGKNDKD